MIKKFGIDPTQPGAIPVDKKLVAQALGLSVADT